MLESESASAREELPTLVTGSLDLHDGVTAELRLVGASVRRVFQLAPLADKLLADPHARGTTFAASCEEPAPTGPRARRCSEAIDHRAALHTREPSVGDTLDVEGALARCVEAPWSDAFLACVDAASSWPDVEHCDAHLAPAERETDFGGMVCGSRDLRVRVDVPLLTLEALKLLQITDRGARADCRSPRALPMPAQLTLGPAAASVCFGGDGTECWTASFAAPGVARWTEGATYTPTGTPCLGPRTLVAPDFQWNPNRAETCELGVASVGAMRLQVATHGAKIEVCRDHACKKLPSPRVLRAISIDARGATVAMVVGAPGHQTLEMWDVASGTRRASFSAGTTAARPCAWPLLLDDTLELATGGCAPNDAASDARLVTTAGKPIAIAGGADFDALAAQPVSLGGTRWAFVARTGDAVAIQDVASGAVEQRIATGAPVDAGLVSFEGDGRGHLVIAYGGAGPRAGSITTIDVPSGTQESFALRVCPL